MTRKRVGMAGLMVLIAFGIFACGTALAEEPGGKAEATRTAAAITEIELQIGERTFFIMLSGHAASQELLEQLPMEITMKELNGNEKYYDLPSPLSADPQNIGSIHAGDLMLFGSDCLVLFYEDFQTAYRYTRLGSMADPDGLAEALEAGTVQVTLRAGERQSSDPVER